jgi:hypothetical protein
MKKFGIFAILLIAALVSAASAAYLPPETPETTGVVSTKTVVCEGAVFDMTDISIENTGAGVLSLGAYSSRMMTRGNTEYVRMASVDSGNMGVTDYNIDVVTGVDFVGNGMVFREGLAEVGTSAGSSKTTCGERASMCVFEKDPGCSEEIYPPFCNSAVVETTMMGETLGFASIGSVRSVASGFDVPAALTYGITAAGTGSIRTSINTIDLDARNLGTEETVYVPSEYTPSEYTPSDYKTFGYIPPYYKPAVYTPSEYTPESIKCLKYTPSSYTPSTFNPGCYIPPIVTPGEYTPSDYVPEQYTPEKFVTVGRPPVPDGITTYREVTTAVGTFTFDQYFTYTSGISR